jgi:hypothetical protein
MRWMGFDSRQGQRNFLVLQSVQPESGARPASSQLDTGVKRPWLETVQSTASSAEVKDGVAIFLLSHIVYLHGVCLNKHRDNFTLPFTLSVDVCVKFV